MKDAERQLVLLGEYRVECVIVGGVAATLHGSSLVTRDLDVCYNREEKNLVRLVTALRLVNAGLRGAPKDLPFRLDEETLRRGLNFTFTTDIGDVDLLGEVPGVGDYAKASEEAEVMALFGFSYQVLSLPDLIVSKRAAGRPKDLLAIPELETILEYQSYFDPALEGRGIDYVAWAGAGKADGQPRRIALRFISKDGDVVEIEEVLTPNSEQTQYLLKPSDELRGRGIQSIRVEVFRERPIHTDIYITMEGEPQPLRVKKKY